MVINFTPLPVAVAGRKRRANTKNPVISKIGWFHEDVGLKELIVKVSDAVK